MKISGSHGFMAPHDIAWPLLTALHTLSKPHYKKLEQSSQQLLDTVAKAIKRNHQYKNPYTNSNNK